MLARLSLRRRTPNVVFEASDNNAINYERIFTLFLLLQLGISILIHSLSPRTTIQTTIANGKQILIWIKLFVLLRCTHMGSNLAKLFIHNYDACLHQNSQPQTKEKHFLCSSFLFLLPNLWWKGKAFKLYGIAEETALQVNRATNDTLRRLQSEAICAVR